MNKMLEETLAQEKPDPAFEQRMLAGFRNRIPQRSGFLKSIVDLMRLRAIQITAVAAVLLALVQVGRLITGEGAAVPPNREYAGGEGRGPQALTDEISAVRKSENGRDKETAARKLKSGFSTTAPQPAAAPAPSPAQMKGQRQESTQVERTIVTGSNISPAEGGEPNPAEASVPALANRKLIRNANVELEIVSFDDAVEKITEFANEERGYVATTSSEKQANGKLKGEIVVKVLPENLDHFLQKLRGIGELKNQTLGTEDVTKAYFDTDARLKNARVMEQRLIDMLKTKTGKVSDLLQVEKELGRVREEIEKMQGELKYWDSQVQFATVTISLAEKDMEEPARFLLKERAQLALYAPDVEKIYNDVKGLGSPKVQITNAQLNRDPDGREIADVSLRVPMKNYPALMESLNSLGKVENVSVQRQDRTDAQIDETNAPADISIQVYSQGNIVSQESGLFATLRRTLTQSAGAIMWSLRMIGVAVAFLAPWTIALVVVIWITRRVIRARQSR